MKCMDWIEKSRPLNTRKTYGRYFTEYLKYAEEKGLHHHSPVALASFMKHTVTTRPRHLGRDTVTTTIPASLAAGFRYTNPGLTQSTLVSEMKKAIKRTVRKEPRVKDPITPEILKEITAGTDHTNLEQTRNFVMVLFMTLGMLRESEAVKE